jgi:hypothetical protein
MELVVRPKLCLEVLVDGRRRHVSEGDLLTKWFRRWLGYLIFPDLTPLNLTDTSGSSFTPSMTSPAGNTAFWDIQAGKDGTSPTESDYKILSPASYTLDSYSVIDISETASGITFGLSKRIRMNETTTLREFGLVGGHYLSGGYMQNKFLVARDTGSVPVQSGQFVDIRYTMTLPVPSLTDTSGYTKWFNRALAHMMTAGGYQYYLGDTWLTNWSPQWLYDFATGTEYKAFYTGPSTCHVEECRVGTGTTAPAYDDRAYITEASSTYYTKSYARTEATGSLTIERWEDRTCSSAVTLKEWIVVGRFWDSNQNDRYYVIHRGRNTAGVSIPAGGIARVYFKLVIST